MNYKTYNYYFNTYPRYLGSEPTLKTHLFSKDNINYDENSTPKEIVLEATSENKQLKLINQLDEEDKSTILKIIDTMLTKKKFKDFFAKNVASL